MKSKSAFITALQFLGWVLPGLVILVFVVGGIGVFNQKLEEVTQLEAPLVRMQTHSLELLLSAPMPDHLGEQFPENSVSEMLEKRSTVLSSVREEWEQSHPFGTFLPWKNEEFPVVLAELERQQENAESGWEQWGQLADRTSVPSLDSASTQEQGDLQEANQIRANWMEGEQKAVVAQNTLMNIVEQRRQQLEQFRRVFWISMGIAGGAYLLGIFLLFAWLYLRPLRKIRKMRAANLTVNAEGKWRSLTPLVDWLRELQVGIQYAKMVANSVGQGEFDYKVPEELLSQPIGHALKDMGERLKQVDEAERVRKWASEGLSQFVEILRSRHEDLESLCQQIIDMLVDYLKANQGVIYLIHKEETAEGEALYLKAAAAYAWGYKQLVTDRFLLNEGLVGAAVYANRVIYMTDLPDNYVRIRSGLGDAQPRNILITPLRVKDQVVGAIEIAAFNRIEQYEIDFLEQLGANIASTIQETRVRRHTEELLAQSRQLTDKLEKREQEILRNVEELQTAKSQMEDKQSELDGLLSSVSQSMAMMETDPEGKILRVNSLMAEVLGVKTSQLEGKTVAQLLGLSTPLPPFWEELQQGRFFTEEIKFPREDGTDTWVQATFSPIFDAEGNLQKVVQLATDTTEAKLAALHYEGHYQAINSTAGTMELDLNGTILSVNDLYLKILGYSREELTGARHRILIPEEELKSGVDTEIWATVESGNNLDGQFRLIRKDGKEKWVRGSFSPILDLEGKVEGVIHIATDVSGQKRMEIKIKEQLEQMASQEEELRQNMEEMQATHEEMERHHAEMNGILKSIDVSMAMVTYDLEGVVLMANNSFLELMRYTQSDLEGKTLHDFFSAKDLEQGVPDQLLQALHQGTYQGGEYRFLNKQGKSIWLNAHFHPIPDSRGQIFKVIQFASPASVEIEAQLRAIQETNAMFMLDVSGKILEANQVICMFLGYEQEELPNRELTTLIPDTGQMGMSMEEVLGQMRKGKPLEGEFSLLAKTGELVWIRGRYHPIEDLSGEVTKILFAGINISEEKVMADRIGEQLIQMSKQRSEMRKNMSELKTTKELLEEKESMMRGQWEAIDSTNGVVKFQLDGTISQCNRLVSSLLKYETPEELEGIHYQELFIVEGDTLDMWDHLKEGKSQFGEYKWKTREGEAVWINATFTPVTDRENQLTCVLTLLTDISERKQHETEILAANEKLNQTLAQLTNTQDQLILSEKMASLGTLVASVAHEVNTPISAIKSSVRNLLRIYPGMVKALPRTLQEAEPEMQELFMELVEAALSFEGVLTTKEERVYKKQIYDILDEMGLEEGYALSGKLVELRVFDHVEKFGPLLEHVHAESLLELANQVALVKINMDNIETAASKTSKIVFALKSYTHVQNEDQFVPTDLRKSIDLILTVYANQLKYGVEVIRDFDDVPDVPIYPDELGQVWTNIIHNAIQAMENKGQLKIAVRREGEFALVRITDNGPGIPEEIQKRIFDPFFTTKPQGEGTGLGLDICRKIVEKHHGTIEVESVPGKTMFTIRLPFEHPEEPSEITTEEAPLVHVELPEPLSVLTPNDITS